MSNDGRSRDLGIPAIVVHQWLDEWNEVEFDDAQRRRQPEPRFYLFTLSAGRLRALANVSRRTTKDGLARSQDIGIQRGLDRARADEIREYVQLGYPWSELNQRKRESGDFDDLRKPGWLPTAIVVNILTTGDERRALTVADGDYVRLEAGDQQGLARVVLPESFDGPDWRPKRLAPIEVIDGQHRLFAFDDGQPDGDYELPVVAFCGLDVSWQAYLFWTINIRPKKINPSLAFDMYPLLRTEDWLERFEGHSIYRETRAQELTEAMWANPQSRWYQRINMLGEAGQKAVSQAAWVRALMASYVKPWAGRRVSIGGLFGAPVGSDDLVLPWCGAQQAAFLIRAWQELSNAVQSSRSAWAEDLRKIGGYEAPDVAFAGPHTLLNGDPGVRSVLAVTNDLCFIEADRLALAQWDAAISGNASDQTAVDACLESLDRQPVADFLGQVATGLATYDWRTASTPGLTNEQKLAKLAFRGSGGYKELRRQLLKLLSAVGGDVGRASLEALEALGYE